MSDGVNKVILLGNLGQDPELRYTQSGTACLNMRLATNESYLKDGQRETKTEWHTVIMWGKRGESLHQYLTRGTRLYVEGRLQTRSYETRAGEKRYTTEIVATEIVLLGDGAGRRREPERESAQPPPANNSNFSDDDDIPF